MNENLIVKVLKEVAAQVGSELETDSEAIPLVFSNSYKVESEKLKLTLKISKTATISARNTNVILTFSISDVVSPFFSIAYKKGISSLLSKKKFKLEGNSDGEHVQFWMTELEQSQIAGLRAFRLEMKNDSLSLNMKTPYIESMMPILSIVLKFMKSL